MESIKIEDVTNRYTYDYSLKIIEWIGIRLGILKIKIESLKNYVKIEIYTIEKIQIK